MHTVVTMVQGGRRIGWRSVSIADVTAEDLSVGAPLPGWTQQTERVYVAATKASPATAEPAKRTATKTPAKRSSTAKSRPSRRSKAAEQPAPPPPGSRAKKASAPAKATKPAEPKESVVAPDLV